MDKAEGDTDKAQVDSYRKHVFAGYTVAGFFIAMIVLVSVQDSLFDEVSSTVATVFTLILGVFTWVGGAIANAIYSVDDAFDPWTHAAAIVKSIPSGLAGIAVLLAVVLLATLIPRGDNVFRRIWFRRVGELASEDQRSKVTTAAPRIYCDWRLGILVNFRSRVGVDVGSPNPICP
ncbi:MAG: hypothetical protein ABSB37_15665 [Xanthobacteraceae bacterium]|jgi:hypothetical protein